MREVIERKLVNICMNTANANIGLNIPFRPDEVIVREFAYNTTEVSNRCLQLTSNMIQDQIMFVFPAYTSSSHLEHAYSLDNFSQNRIWNFQVQTLPVAGTGAGAENTVSIGQLFFILEFVKYRHHQ